MELIIAVAFAFIAGLTVFGLAASFLELFSGARLGFRDPFVTPQRFWRSCAVAVCAGPVLLANEALAAHREGSLGLPGFVSAMATAATWVLAAGVVAISVVLKLAGQVC